MKPSDICSTVLGQQKLTAILEKLTNPQIKAVLKEGDIRVKLPAGYVSQQKRRDLWLRKITAQLEEGNQQAAAELLQQFLLNHRRLLLVQFLDRLEVKHRHGETDESFLVTRPQERIREAAQWLLGQHDRAEVAAYLLYIAHQQRSSVFDGWTELPPASPSPEQPPVLQA